MVCARKTKYISFSVNVKFYAYPLVVVVNFHRCDDSCILTITVKISPVVCPLCATFFDIFIFNHIYKRLFFLHFQPILMHFKMGMFCGSVVNTVDFYPSNSCLMEKDAQTLRAGCSKAKPKNFAPPQTPFPGVWDNQNLISWRWSLLSPTNPVW